jgi:ubiquinone biosynthesis monooxygenase Coq7
MARERQYSEVDRLLIGAGNALAVLCKPAQASRAYPANAADAELSSRDRRNSAGYMRVNHVGEVCAQALYQSQALTARSEKTRNQMASAAAEEIDHLAWCEQRLEELGSRKSLLNPLWYAGSFAIGTAAGLAGDRWNLGFVEETEKQVVEHLENHLTVLPEADVRSREVVSRMKTDEAEHAAMARDAGAAPLPGPVRGLMKLASRVMTRTAFWI